MLRPFCAMSIWMRRKRCRCSPTCARLFPRTKRARCSPWPACDAAPGPNLVSLPTRSSSPKKRLNNRPPTPSPITAPPGSMPTRPPARCSISAAASAATCSRLPTAAPLWPTSAIRCGWPLPAPTSRPRGWPGAWNSIKPIGRRPPSVIRYPPAALAHLLLPAAAFVDPARRVDGRRVFRLADLLPPIDAVLPLRERIALIGVKVMPGVGDDDVASLPDDLGGWCVEFVSHERTCKEAVLWWQRAFAGDAPLRWPASTVATAFGGGSAARVKRRRWATCVPGQLLYEPDPAVIRAGAFAELCARLDAHLFDPQIAYLVADEAAASPSAASRKALQFCADLPAARNPRLWAQAAQRPPARARRGARRTQKNGVHLSSRRRCAPGSSSRARATPSSSSPGAATSR